jgi:hypothetical protein
MTQEKLPGILPPHDSVAHPSHYNAGRIEVIEAIEDWGCGFHRGNAIKYIARAGKKDPSKEIEDLKKAVWYLNRLIETMQAEKEKREPLKPNDMVTAQNSVTTGDYISVTAASTSTGCVLPRVIVPHAVEMLGYWSERQNPNMAAGMNELCFIPYDRPKVKDEISCAIWAVPNAE